MSRWTSKETDYLASVYSTDIPVNAMVKHLKRSEASIRRKAKAIGVQRRNKNRLERFWERVKTGSGCWEWVGGRNSDGYGNFWFSDKCEKAHRVSWIIHNGPIPNGSHILHSCDHPWCGKSKTPFCRNAPRQHDRQNT